MVLSPLLNFNYRYEINFSTSLCSVEQINLISQNPLFQGIKLELSSLILTSEE